MPIRLASVSDNPLIRRMICPESFETTEHLHGRQARPFRPGGIFLRAVSTELRRALAEDTMESLQENRMVASQVGQIFVGRPLARSCTGHDRLRSSLAQEDGYHFKLRLEA
jgi:hypothetical protein